MIRAHVLPGMSHSGHATVTITGTEDSNAVAHNIFRDFFVEPKMRIPLEVAVDVA